MLRRNGGAMRFVFVIFLFITVVCEDSYSMDLQNWDDCKIDLSFECDRTCLIDFMSSYLDALVANNPTRLFVSESVRYTENGVVSEIGEGLWQTATGIEPDTRLDFADPKMGQVGSQLVINIQNGERISPVLYQVRLKVVHHEITEIETMVLKGLFYPRGMVPPPVFNEPLDPETRMTREELTEVVGLYMDYLEGTIKGRDVPFDRHCARYENGIPTANGILAFWLQSFWRFNVTRRYLVFDEEAGIVWGMFPFSQHNTTLVVGEAFKIIDGKIMMIQAVMRVMPAKAWE